MSNHPNRNWRRAMHAAADAHLDAYRCPEGGVHMMTPEQLRDALRTAYLAGYSDCRLSIRPPKGADNEPA
jgi:hypothetical protein